MVLVFAEQQNGTFKKATLEALSYGSKVAEQLGTEMSAVVLGECADTSTLAQYGADKIFHNGNAALNNYSSRAYTNAIAQVAQNASVVILSDNVSARGIAPRLSARMQAGLVSGAIALPDTSNGFTVKKNVFSGKAFAHVNVTSDKKIISVTPNAFGLIENPKAGAVETFETTLDEKDTAIQILDTSTVTGDTVPLPEAELVVSGGRGLKGPENWGMVEDLAATIGATLACSRPVADSHWRPHHEHVGQTGGTIRPNLYIAIGISGAIQHLAGVNASKTIVVINKDPEAPFFKAADYGIVGDAFEVVPKLTEALKSFKAAQAN